MSFKEKSSLTLDASQKLICFSTKTYAVDIRKNHFNEHLKQMFKLMEKKMITILPSIFSADPCIKDVFKSCPECHSKVT